MANERRRLTGEMKPRAEGNVPERDRQRLSEELQAKCGSDGGALARNRNTTRSDCARREGDGRGKLRNQMIPYRIALGDAQSNNPTLWHGRAEQVDPAEGSRKRMGAQGR